MDDKPQHKPRFWPVVFLVAFLIGAVLWGFGWPDSSSRPAPVAQIRSLRARFDQHQQPFYTIPRRFTLSANDLPPRLVQSKEFCALDSLCPTSTGKLLT